jgi:hypothetical protein
VELGLWVRVGKQSPGEHDHGKSRHVCDEIGTGLAACAAMQSDGTGTTSHELARVNSDVACRADRCRSSMRRLCYGQALAPVMPDPPRRFPTPWRTDKIPGGYVVRGANGQALAYLYSRDNEDEAGQAKVLTKERGAPDRRQRRGCRSCSGGLSPIESPKSAV